MIETAILMKNLKEIFSNEPENFKYFIDDLKRYNLEIFIPPQQTIAVNTFMQTKDETKKIEITSFIENKLSAQKINNNDYNYCQQFMNILFKKLDEAQKATVGYEILKLSQDSNKNIIQQHIQYQSQSVDVSVQIQNNITPLIKKYDKNADKKTKLELVLNIISKIASIVPGLNQAVEILKELILFFAKEEENT